MRKHEFEPVTSENDGAKLTKFNLTRNEYLEILNTVIGIFVVAAAFVIAGWTGGILRPVGEKILDGLTSVNAEYAKGDPNQLLFERTKSEIQLLWFNGDSVDAGTLKKIRIQLNDLYVNHEYNSTSLATNSEEFVPGLWDGVQVAKCYVDRLLDKDLVFTKLPEFLTSVSNTKAYLKVAIFMEDECKTKAASANARAQIAFLESTLDATTGTKTNLHFVAALVDIRNLTGFSEQSLEKELHDEADKSKK
eukprot:777624_1